MRVSALFLLLVYFSMPLGICILAAGKQRAWSIVQSLCVGVSFVLDPLLIPWFQRRNGNGGLGPCVAAVVSEVVVVALGVALAPQGIFDRRFARSLLLALASGAAMILVAASTRSVTPFVSAPLAVITYAASLWVTGALEQSHVEAIRNFVGRRILRRR
ncbi:MAG: polysaccharide biosynthesis C-terminal domain-containing protein [Pseudomonadota bacterium]